MLVHIQWPREPRRSEGCVQKIFWYTISLNILWKKHLYHWCPRQLPQYQMYPFSNVHKSSHKHMKIYIYTLTICKPCHCRNQKSFTLISVSVVVTLGVFTPSKLDCSSPFFSWMIRSCLFCRNLEWGWLLTRSHFWNQLRQKTICNHLEVW